MAISLPLSQAEGLLVAFIVFWCACLSLPPGRTTWYGIMRQHFVHACFSSVLSALAIAELCPVEVAIHCSLGYFGVDMVNMLLNDLIFPIPSYQKPMNRAVEYVHHVLVFVSGVLLYKYSDTQCVPGTINPFAALLVNEATTVFLIVYRFRGEFIWGALFAVSFFLVRILGNLLYFSPILSAACAPWMVRSMWYPFVLLQVFMFGQILLALRSKSKAR